MFPINKGGPATTQPATPTTGADPWANMRDAAQPNVFDKMKAAVQQQQVKINNMPPDQKRRLDQFQKLAGQEQQAAQFAPVQFGGAGGAGGQLSEYVKALRERLNGGMG